MSEENQVYNRIQAAYANLLPEHKSSALFLLDKVLEIVDEVSINFPMATYADNLTTLRGCLQLNMKRHEWFVKYFKVKRNEAEKHG